MQVIKHHEGHITCKKFPKNIFVLLGTLTKLSRAWNWKLSFELECREKYISDAVYVPFNVDEPNSSVASAFWEDGDTFSATIQTSSDIFAVEVCTVEHCVSLFFNCVILVS